jgi:hypothetical protein
MERRVFVQMVISMIFRLEVVLYVFNAMPIVKHAQALIRV